jgi:hypothetical protein
LTESVLGEIPCQLSQCGAYEIYICLEFANNLTFLSFRIDSVDVESNSASTQLTENETPLHRVQGMIKISNILAKSRIKLKSLKSLILGLCMFDASKNQNTKNSCKCTFKKILDGKVCNGNRGLLYNESHSIHRMYNCVCIMYSCVLNVI